jgi:hypothetical protein
MPTCLEAYNSDPLNPTAVKPEQDLATKEKVGSMHDLPYELLEQIASEIISGNELVKWVTACKLGGVVNLGDLELLVYLPEAIGHEDISLKKPLEVGKQLDHDACVLLGEVSRFYTRMEFDGYCLTTLLSINFSKKC